MKKFISIAFSLVFVSGCRQINFVALGLSSVVIGGAVYNAVRDNTADNLKTHSYRCNPSKYSIKQSIL
ncbi:MAG: hypothetical protein LBS15_03060 [Endomicrobium sp.]|jgi:hypothetical protein|nr:hypothetical protein [Endomicrobium sp.]